MITFDFDLIFEDRDYPGLTIAGEFGAVEKLHSANAAMEGMLTQTRVVSTARWKPASRKRL